jgi:catechol 2,3-dioxygenase-like lactoylglutathione lyase family enzyme
MSGTTPHEAIPVLRVVDASAAAAWYERLGFSEDWRHQYEPGFPWFISISAPGGATLFLSEHAEDAPPGGTVYLVVHDIAEMARSCGTAATEQPWGDLEFTVQDPDGNRLRVGQPAS